MNLTNAGTLVAALSILASVATIRAQGEPVSIEGEPRHRIVFTDERLRVLEVHVPAGDTTLEHRHDHDMLTVNIENGPTRTRDRGADWGGIRPRDVGGINVNEYTGKPLAHTLQTVGDRGYRLTGVENRKPGNWTTLGAVSAPGLEVATESRAFRAYRLRLAAAATASHTHAVPVVVTLVEGAVTLPSDTDRMLNAPGQWTVIAAGAAHAVKAGGSGAHLVEIEVR